MCLDFRNPDNDNAENGKKRGEKAQGGAKEERGAGGPTLLKALRYRERRRDDHLVDVPKAGLYGGQRLLFRTKRNARKAVIKR